MGQPTVDTAGSTGDAKLQAVELELTPTTRASTAATLSATDNQPVTNKAAAAPRAPTATAPRVVASLLSAIGFGTQATNGPLAPGAPAPMLLGALEFMRREINRVFFNESPGFTHKSAENSLVDGKIVGKLTVDDPDSTDFTFTATKPTRGEVEIGSDGTFVCTPGATFTGQDSFDVTVSDVSSGFHIHGLSGLVNLVTFGLLGDSGHTYTRAVHIGGFTPTTLVSGLEQPTDFRLLPHGRILFAEKGGAIKVADNHGQLQSTPVITLPVATYWARGLSAIEVDPDYQENGHVYVAYIGADNYQRLSRLTVTDPTAEVLTIDPASEKVLLQGTEPAGDDHHGGGLGFGRDGKLYWSVGDNVCCTVIDGSNSQDITNMYGKVLRINRDGTVPTDNPFYDGAGPNYDAIYSTGFRNPFRLGFSPDGQLLVVDVGQATWEEVNLVTAGANYGGRTLKAPATGLAQPAVRHLPCTPTRSMPTGIPAAEVRSRLSWSIPARPLTAAKTPS